MFDEFTETRDPYRGMNPEFVKRVQAKRRAEAERARAQERATGLLAKKTEASRRLAVEAEQRAMAKAREAASALMLPQTKFRRIEQRACATFNLLRSELYSNRRNKEVVLARQFVAYWACRLTPLSFPQIGKLMGGYDHTTILHNRNVYRERRASTGRTLRKVR